MKTYTYTLFWLRRDGQGWFNMGDFATHAEAEAAIPAARATLLQECGSESDREGIEAGSFEVEENETDKDDEDNEGAVRVSEAK